jgi:tetratricopeptide (TPR) repeat protein
MHPGAPAHFLLLPAEATAILCPMKPIRHFLCVLACSVSFAPLGAQTPDPAPAAPLSPEVSEKLASIIKEVQQLHSRQRYAEAMLKLNEADTIAPNNAMLANVRGSIYTNMRDFAKAKESFLKAQTLSPVAFEPRFNLTELLYVEQKYPEAEAAFTKLLADFPKLREDVRHLTRFKIIICQLKQNKTEDAIKGTAAFTSMDDTPAYFFCKAAFAFQKDDKADAQSWIAKAQKIFKPQQNAVYLDSLMEARWLQSLAVPDEKPAK